MFNRLPFQKKKTNMDVLREICNRNDAFEAGIFLKNMLFRIPDWNTRDMAKAIQIYLRCQYWEPQHDKTKE